MSFFQIIFNPKKLSNIFFFFFFIYIHILQCIFENGINPLIEFTQLINTALHQGSADHHKVSQETFLDKGVFLT